MFYIYLIDPKKIRGEGTCSEKSSIFFPVNVPPISFFEMNPWKKIPEFFLKDIFNNTPDVFEKARIRMAFNVSVMAIIVLIPLDVILINSKLYVSLAVSLTAKAGMITCIYFIKYKNNFRLGAKITALIIFTGLSVHLLISETIALGDIFWFVLLIMFVFFTLNEKWGYTISICSLIINFIYIKFYFYSNFHDEAIYSSRQLLTLAATFILGYVIALSIMKEVRDAQEEAELKLKENLSSLENLNQKLENSNSELNISNKNLESFSYSVSHDLRAPLRAINGFSDLLVKSYGDKLPPEAKELVDSVQKNTNKMDTLINDLLAFSRSGSKDLQKEAIDMDDLLQSVLAEYEKDEGKITAVLKISPLLPVTGDPTLIRQVLYNLISNAVKYSSKKEKPEIEIGCIQKANESIFFIRDNGIGFDMKYVNRLFTIFQRLHSESEFKGTGIGLAIVKQIISRHGGKVWAESRPGEGATFYFSLPKIQ